MVWRKLSIYYSKIASIPRDHRGCIPLSRAAESRRTSIITLLLKNGVDVKLTIDNISAALDIALQMKHSDMAVLLLKQGADIRTRNDKGWTPLHEASQTA